MSLIGSGIRAAAAALLLQVTGAGAVIHGEPQAFVVTYEHRLSPELRRPLELWIRQTLRAAAPGVPVQFVPREEEPVDAVNLLNVTSTRANQIPTGALKRLIEPGVRIGADEIATLNERYRADPEGSSTCLLLIDRPAILVSPRAAVQRPPRSERDPDSTLIRFPAWLNAKPAGLSYARPNFADLDVVLVRFGHDWERIAPQISQFLNGQCGSRAAATITEESGMSIVPPLIELKE